MPSERRHRYSFRPVTEDDLPMLAVWLAEPHVAEWWDDAEVELAAIREHIDSISVEPLIVELDGRRSPTSKATIRIWKTAIPIRISRSARSASTSRSASPELVGIGHGSAIVRQFTDQLFAEGAPRVIIDPDPANRRAIRAYEKAGFRPIGERTSEYGHVVLMARDAEEGNTMTTGGGTGVETARDIDEGREY